MVWGKGLYRVRKKRKSEGRLRCEEAKNQREPLSLHISYIMFSIKRTPFCGIPSLDFIEKMECVRWKKRKEKRSRLCYAVECVSYLLVRLRIHNMIPQLQKWFVEPLHCQLLNDKNGRFRGVSIQPLIVLSGRFKI